MLYLLQGAAWLQPKTESLRKPQRKANETANFKRLGFVFQLSPALSKKPLTGWGQRLHTLPTGRSLYGDSDGAQRVGVTSLPRARAPEPGFGVPSFPAQPAWAPSRWHFGSSCQEGMDVGLGRCQHSCLSGPKSSLLNDLLQRVKICFHLQ